MADKALNCSDLAKLKGAVGMAQFSLRDTSGWLSNGLPVYSASNTACKMYDSALFQVLGSHSHSTWGNTSETIELMLQEDPDFVMGNVLDCNLALLMGDTSPSDPSIVKKLSRLQELKARKQNMNCWESKHVQAVEYLAKGQLENVSDTWQSILVEYPKDALCLRFGYYVIAFQGDKFNELRDMLARGVAAFHPSEPEYGYILGLYGFALEQTHFYDKAEAVTAQALRIYPDCAQSTHSMSHVLDATARYEEGLEFLTDTASLWEKSAGIACHLHWHKALCHIEKGNFKEALDAYDTELSKRSKEKEGYYTSRLRDVVTLLYRLKLEGVEAGAERWREVADICEKHMDDHTVALTDAHIMLGLCGGKRQQPADKFLQSVRDIVSAGKDTTVTRAASHVTLALCEAMAAFERGDYEAAVDGLLSIKYKIIHIGGSRTQRDIFNQMLVHAAILSPNPLHQELAKQLLLERKEYKDTPVVDRLNAKLLQRHENDQH